MKAEWTNADSLTISQTTKAILVIEMPNDCNECPLNSNGYCDVLQEYASLNEWVEDAPYYSLKEKGVCPLKPMPQEQDIYEIGMDEEDTNAKRQWNKGWDACLNKILGETE